MALCGVMAAQAVVTITGSVTYYDALRATYQPAQQVLVSTQGAWPAPAVQTCTDAAGRFTMTVVAPPPKPSTLRVAVLAQTPDRLAVYERSDAAAPYTVISPLMTGVRAGKICAFTLRIGGPQHNVTTTGSRTPAEHANALLVQQEALAHCRALEQLGFPAELFRQASIIVPTGGRISCYSYLTDCVYLTAETMTGKAQHQEKGDDWSQLNRAQTADTDYFDVLDTVRHEMSHRVHARLAAGNVLGLNLPVVHHPGMATNDFVAFSEGFANFLPLVTLGIAGKYEAAPSRYAVGDALPLPNTSPPPDHSRWEGEVTAVLLDLYDPAGVQERMRFPATNSLDGQVAPRALVEAQCWADNVADPALTQICAVLRDAGPMQTIDDFLHVYLKRAPQQAYAVKAIAYNRCIEIADFPEHQPTLDAPIQLRWLDAQTLAIHGQLQEADAEDRPHVTLGLWRQRGAAVSALIAPRTCPTGWDGARCAFSEMLPCAQAEAGDRLWIIVSDGMRATAYCQPLPDGRVAPDPLRMAATGASQ